MSDKISAIENQSLFADLSQGESDAIKGGFNWEEVAFGKDSPVNRQGDIVLVGRDFNFGNNSVFNESDLNVGVA